MKTLEAYSINSPVAPVGYLWIVIAMLCCTVGPHAHGQSPEPDAFNPGANNGVYSLALQADGRILVGGIFRILGGGTCDCLGRLRTDGTLDSGFNRPALYDAGSIVVQTDGKILVAGNLVLLGGQPCSFLGRLNADGTLDTEFNPGAGSQVATLALQPDGKILVGGDFLRLGSQWRSHIGRLFADGTLDTGFDPGVEGGGGPPTSVLALAMQADGKILVGGQFTKLAGQPRSNIGRLNADGTLDPEFNPGAGNWVSSLAVQADGKILVGGQFTTLGGQPRSNIGRLNSDGTLDSQFNPGANKAVSSLAVQADGKILVGGQFTTLGGEPRSNIGRLNADGALDSEFNPGANGSVSSLLLQEDGKVLVGGSFTTLGGQSRSKIGRLNNTDPATQHLTYDGSTVTWLRGGTSPEVWRTTFELSTNGSEWMILGEGMRIPGGWQRSAVSVALTGTIRARGYVASGGFSGSSWFVESLAGIRPTIAIGNNQFGVISNRFGFQVRGSTGDVVVVESSSNLLDWVPVCTNTLSSDSFNFNDPDWLQRPWGFYRAGVIR